MTQANNDFPWIILSAGHEPRDQGSSEHEIVTQICWYAVGSLQQHELREYINVIPVPALRLEDKIDFVNENVRVLRGRGLSSLALEVHLDHGQPTARGVTTYHRSKNALTRHVGRAMLKVLQGASFKDRGARPDTERLAWVRQTDGPALVLKYGYVTNEDDLMQYHESPQARYSAGQLLAHAIVAGGLEMQARQRGPKAGTHTAREWRDGKIQGN